MNASAAGEPVDVWVIPTDQPPAVVRRLRGLLDPGERARADAAHDPVQGARFTVARGAVRLLVAGRLGIDAARLAWQYGPHGKPSPVTPAPLQVNWSGSGALAVLAVAEGRRVGVDVEELRPPGVGARIARRHFPPTDAALVLDAPTPAEGAEHFTRLWCRREACVKVYGGRLAQGLGLALAGPSPLHLPEAGTLGPGPLRLADVPVPGPYRAAVAADRDTPLMVRQYSWCAPELP
ncbi:4'-phosphopantetheinyl transferase family protein [Kitasatospora sp. NPDC051853]|uniref:4'-phosphopantetheinyl transferase family protein n=1 Tax=Kitasatospora sp. NPDC051853 TaxID=3364058 RepID=UPI0037B8312B